MFNNKANSLTNISYSIRRHYVDNFFIELGKHCHYKDKSILDIGGQKAIKRGSFDISKFNENVKYVNIAERTDPDYLCSGDDIPVEDKSFDIVIMSETLEHVINPEDFIKEASRILKTNGKIILCTPFIYHVHADPYDFGRYTDTWYKTILEKYGFKNIHIEKQGGFYACFVQMIRLWMHDKTKSNCRVKRVFYRILHSLLTPIFKYIMKKDNDKNKSNIFTGYTTGYGVIAEKE